jgi:nucleoid-associated protein YgaU
VAEGDTLFDIARAELGKASRWAEIYELNRDQLGEDFNYLAPGMQLVMPPRGDRPESITTRPSRDAYRR